MVRAAVQQEVPQLSRGDVVAQPKRVEDVELGVVGDGAGGERAVGRVLVVVGGGLAGGLAGGWGGGGQRVLAVGLLALDIVCEVGEGLGVRGLAWMRRGGESHGSCVMAR